MGGLIHGRSFVFIVINKSDINKSVINREINVYSAAITGLILRANIFGWALIFGGGLIFGMR
jgi:hypothetical protein